MQNKSPQSDDSELPEDVLTPGEQVSRVIADVRKVARAELDYYFSRLSYSRFVMRWAFRYGAIAAFTFGAAGIALVMGLVLTLSPKVGPLAATVIVTGGFAAIGIAAGMKARQWFRKIYFPEVDGDQNGQP